ncbi:MAG: hypothetical protein J0H78_16365 [Rhizobiales bacterium]|nr:hypothetical protein [Hyphomicrobiales bacterium]
MPPSQIKKPQTKPTKPTPGRIVIVYGPSEDGRPRAGRFNGREAEAAIKAAAAMDMVALEAKEPAVREFALKLPAGRISKTGRGFVPYLPKGLHEGLKSLTSPSDASAKIKYAAAAAAKGDVVKAAVKESTKGLWLPTSWDKIGVGALVLAQDDDPKDGWWQAIVVDAKADVVTLRWHNGTSRRPFSRHKINLGLLQPSEKPTLAFKADPASKYPANWAAIAVNHTVLAKEDGPMQQWWEATVRTMKSDAATLSWRDYPSLPELHRPRPALALLHPMPVKPKTA